MIKDISLYALAVLASKFAISKLLNTLWKNVKDTNSIK